MWLSKRLACKFVILAFLLRGAFYCVEQPIWEGLDEWGHFGYIQHLAQHGRPPSRSDSISAELQRSLELAPVSASAAEYSRASLTHDAFWRLSPQERTARERQLAQLRPQYTNPTAGSQPLKQYEAQHPPLYYFVLVPVYILFENASLPAQVLALRIASLWISAFGLWLCYKVALRMPGSRRAAIPALLLLSAWPGFLVYASRIGNDALAFTLGSAYVLCLFRIAGAESRLSDWVLAGIVLGAALLAKSYMLALVPLLPAVAVLRATRSRSGTWTAWRGIMAASALVALIAGWWYLGTYTATGTLSGEQIDAAAARVGLLGKISAVGKIEWGKVLDSAATTHLWTAGWSFLAVRAWMYRVFEFLGIVAGAGLVALAIRVFRKARDRGLSAGGARFLIAGLACFLFCSALAYQAAIIYVAVGISTGIGWYLYGIVAVEAALLASGFTGLAGSRRAAGLIAATGALACAFDFYTVHFVSVPYYTGLIAHLPSGFLASFHPASALRDIGLGEILARLATNKPVGPPAIATAWIGYLCGTFGLLAYSVSLMRTAFSRTTGTSASVVLHK